MQVLKPRGGLPRDVKVNFLGDLTSHRLRQEMATALIAEPGFVIGKVCPLTVDMHLMHGLPAAYQHNIETLLVCGVAPPIVPAQD
jgi:hypothetical protein